jgi:amino acid permease
MDTYKLIRKICLVLTVIGCIFFVLYVTLYEEPEAAGIVSIIGIAIYLGVYVFFEVVSKIIEAVKKDTGKMKVFSDKQYLEAYSEVEENNIQNKELWAKAFAQCGGDKEKQKSIYVELRTKELSKG